jgi:hypothetical protein
MQVARDTSADMPIQYTAASRPNAAADAHATNGTAVAEQHAEGRLYHGAKTQLSWRRRRCSVT